MLIAALLAGTYWMFGTDLVLHFANERCVAIANCVVGTILVFLVAVAVRFYTMEHSGTYQLRHSILDDTRFLHEFILTSRAELDDLEQQLATSNSRLSPYGMRCLEIARSVVKEAVHAHAVAEALLETNSPYDLEAARAALDKVIVVDHHATIYLDGEPIPALSSVSWEPWMELLVGQIRQQFARAA